MTTKTCVYLYCDNPDCEYGVNTDAINNGMEHATATEARSWANREGGWYPVGEHDFCSEECREAGAGQ